MSTTTNDLLLAYYGDDFTGSTDVMEALSKAGLRTVLFLSPPSPQQLSRFPGLRAFGIAGGSRTSSPDDMDCILPPAFEALRESGAPIIHYKVCSTFDSSPQIGSIGRAIEIGRRIFGRRPIPLVIGAPVLGRYVAFGNLFARSGLDTDPFRLDRHPTMSRHPVTPMQEADIRLILARQTTLAVELIDVLALDQTPASSPVEVAANSSAPIVLFDTLRQEHLPIIGASIEAMAQGGPLFTVGSSGVEYALTARWNQGVNHPPANGKNPKQTQVPPLTAASGLGTFTPKSVKQIIAVSGSCSPVTARQIARAVKQGFAAVSAGPKVFAQRNASDRTLGAARRRLGERRSVVVRTSRGPDDDRYDAQLSNAEQSSLCISLGQMLEELLSRSGIRRAVVCGGDTSMHVARALGIEAIEYLGPIAPGSPLCRVHAPGRVADGCEMVFKGGQVGRDDFFLDVLNGSPMKPLSGRSVDSHKRIAKRP